MSKWVDGWWVWERMGRQMAGRMSGWVNEWHNEYMYGCYGWMGRYIMNVWMLWMGE